MSFRPSALRTALSLIFFVMIPMVSSIAWAADPTGDAWGGGAPPGGGETGLFGLLFRVALSLAFIVLLIWGAVWVMRRFSDAGPRTGGGDLVEILGRSHIAPKKAVYVLRIGDRALAVGVTESTITPLTELDLADTLSACAEGFSARQNIPFSDLLGGIKSRLSKDRK